MREGEPAVGSGEPRTEQIEVPFDLRPGRGRLGGDEVTGEADARRRALPPLPGGGQMVPGEGAAGRVGEAGGRQEVQQAPLGAREVGLGRQHRSVGWAPHAGGLGRPSQQGLPAPGRYAPHRHRDPAARPGHPVQLGRRAPRPADVVQHEVGGHRVEGGVGEGQDRQFGDTDVGRRHRLRGELDHARFGVDGRDPRAPCVRRRGDVPRPGADIQQMDAGTGPDGVEQGPDRIRAHRREGLRVRDGPPRPDRAPALVEPAPVETGHRGINPLGPGTPRPGSDRSGPAGPAATPYSAGVSVARSPVDHFSSMLPNFQTVRATAQVRKNRPTMT